MGWPARLVAAEDCLADRRLATARRASVMVELGKNPKYWRKCAEWARRIANAMQDEQARRLVLSVAKDYERAAELTEKHLKQAVSPGGGYTPAGEDHCFITAEFLPGEPSQPFKFGEHLARI
jgi:hypothetical protein